MYLSGFTLVELLSVIVILSILATLGSQFVVRIIDGNQQSQARSTLMSRGKLVIEQLTRQLRSAAVHSVRVSSSGNCIEFLPIVAGANYLNDLPDESNLAMGRDTISTASFSNPSGIAEHVLVGALSTSEIYTLNIPASRASVNLVGAGPFMQIPLHANHQFIRNSISKRFFITSSPQRFCLSGGSLYSYTSYGLLLSLNDSNPGGDISLMADNVSSPAMAFNISSQTQDRNSAIDIDLSFSENTTIVSFYQRVFLHNVP